VQLAHQAAILNSNITADSIEANEYPTLANKYAVRGVPKTVINDKIEFVGSLPELEFVQQLLAAVQPPA